MATGSDATRADSGDEPEVVAPLPAVWAAAGEYAIDAWQRSILFLDTLRRRGNQYLEHTQERSPHVLSFEFEPILLGWQLERPCNYALVRIVPPPGILTHARARPFVVVDPRAGHGPGIGGFKADSEIGVALRAGHPCYFIGFLPEPVPGQTIEDVARAEARFLDEVIARHPEAEGKPCVIGNCQAGWAVMMLAAIRPDLFGPIIVAGSPLSYWAGVRGKNPMRYAGGLLGGSWLTALTGDLGGGRFDGAWLVENFESLNPANTFWTKQYNVWAKADTEPERYLGFERYWGGYALLNAEEMQAIVDNLFVGNKLATAEIVTSDGVRVDLRNIKSPIVCFCSHGDNITPPQQALGWITDLYANVDDIRAQGQTIVYCVHDKIGHLGIFVSGGVAKKEHQEFAHNIDFIDCLPPGLYEAVIRPRSPDDGDPDLGDYVVRFETRDLADIRRLGGNDEEDERRFATAARVSEINLGLYRTFLQPLVKAMVTPQGAEMMAKLHPARVEFEAFADSNPWMRPVAEWAERARANRRPASPGNPFIEAQEQLSAAMVRSLDTFREWRDQLEEEVFLAVYGSPLLQALVGLRASDESPRRRPGTEPEERALIARRVEELRQRIGTGGTAEAFVRSVIYIRMAAGAADERTFNVVRQIRADYAPQISLREFKDLIRNQYLLLVLDSDAAVAALPQLMRGHENIAAEMLTLVRQTVGAVGQLGEEEVARLAEVERIFAELGKEPSAAVPARPAEAPRAPTPRRSQRRQPA
jgi:hypothetical protein